MPIHSLVPLFKRTVDFAMEHVALQSKYTAVTESLIVAIGTDDVVEHAICQPMGRYEFCASMTGFRYAEKR